MRAVLLSWSEWTDERIDGALRETGYRWPEVVPDIARHTIWKPYDNRTNLGSEALELKELVKAVGRVREWLSKRAVSAGAKPPAAVTASEERRTEPVASDQAQHAEDVTALPDSAHADPADPAAVEVEANPPPGELELVQAAGGHAVDIVEAKATGQPFDIHKLIADLNAKRSATASRPEPAEAPTPAVEDDAQPPADDPARYFDIPESLRDRMIPANPADLAGVRFQVLVKRTPLVSASAGSPTVSVTAEAVAVA